MTNRVEPYAIRNGYAWYAGTPKWISRKWEHVAPKTLGKIDMWFNQRWINREMKQGSRIVDIGERPGMPPSDFYNMERRLTEKYWNYIQDIQP